MVSKYLTNIIASGMQIVKGIDAVTREQLVRVMSLLGVQNVTPVFSMVPTVGPFKPAALIPTITEEDEVILNNVQMVVELNKKKKSQGGEGESQYILERVE